MARLVRFQATSFNNNTQTYEPDSGKTFFINPDHIALVVQYNTDGPNTSTVFLDGVSFNDSIKVGASPKEICYAVEGIAPLHGEKAK